MVEFNLRVIQGAINQKILQIKLNFSVRIVKTFIHWEKVPLIRYDEKPIEWAQEIAWECLHPR